MQVKPTNLQLTHTHTHTHTTHTPHKHHTHTHTTHTQTVSYPFFMCFMMLSYIWLNISRSSCSPNRIWDCMWVYENNVQMISTHTRHRTHPCLQSLHEGHHQYTHQHTHTHTCIHNNKPSTSIHRRSLHQPRVHSYDRSIVLCQCWLRYLGNRKKTGLIPSPVWTSPHPDTSSYA